VDSESAEVALCAAVDIPENGMLQCEHDGALILLCRAGSEIHAVEGTCPHRGAQLAQGRLEGTTVVCPWHDWEFDVQTGCGTTNPMSSLKKFQVDVRSGQVYLVKPR